MYVDNLLPRQKWQALGVGRQPNTIPDVSHPEEPDNTLKQGTEPRHHLGCQLLHNAEERLVYSASTCSSHALGEALVASNVPLVDACVLQPTLISISSLHNSERVQLEDSNL